MTLWIITLGTGLGATGCSGLPSRIRAHEKEFNSYPKPVQSKIRDGDIAVGFTEDMVLLAKGEPSQKANVQAIGHHYINWSYERSHVVPIPGSPTDSFANPYGYPSFGPAPIRPAAVIGKYTYLLVRFEDGRVVDWRNFPDSGADSELRQ